MIDSALLHMRHIRRLRDDRAVRTLVLDRFRAAQSDGVIPPRPAPEDDDPLVTALAGETIAGFAVYQLCTHKRVWLDVLWVEPAFRRRGVGTQLLHEVELATRRLRYRTVCLGHEQDNAAMVSLMERTGWQVDHIVRARELRP